MKFLAISIFSMFMLLYSIAAKSNIYIIIYATCNGKTGHSGIAVDNYQERHVNKIWDTIPDGTLSYFDLWPRNDKFPLLSFSKDREASAYRLPNSIWPAPITVSSLCSKGLPHREFYPCNALLMIKTSPSVGYRFKKFMDSLVETKKIFNARFYNCSDFVYEALHHFFPGIPCAREFIPFSFSTTPNMLCRKLMSKKEVVILKNPGRSIRPSFFWSRVLKKKNT